jgi:hypothetical protein
MRGNARTIDDLSFRDVVNMPLKGEHLTLCGKLLIPGDQRADLCNGMKLSVFEGPFAPTIQRDVVNSKLVATKMTAYSEE